MLNDWQYVSWLDRRRQVLQKLCAEVGEEVKVQEVVESKSEMRQGHQSRLVADSQASDAASIVSRMYGRREVQLTFAALPT